jgi:hypothetical protein
MRMERLSRLAIALVLVGCGSGGAAGEDAGGHDAQTRDAARGGDAANADAASDTDASGADASTSEDASTPVDAGGVRDLSTDRGLFFGSTRCASADVLFCEDFEGGAIDTSRWTSLGTPPALDTVRAARGAQSMHFHTTGNGQSRLQTDAIFPVTGGRYYGRMFVWIDALPTAPDWAHWTLVGASGDTHAGEIRVGGQWDRTRNRFGVGTDGGDTGDWTNLDGDPSGAVVPAAEDQWACIEWMHDASTDTTQFFWDATEHPSLATTATDHGGSSADYLLPDFRSVWIGWWLYQSGPTPDHFDVWIDEVVLDDERIGCVL